MAGTSPREKLLQAVVEVALVDGIADKSLRAIAAAAGTSHRMLIHHFGSREGLLVAVIRAVETRQRDIFNDLTATTGGADMEPGLRFWEHLRSKELVPQERLFFEVYGQALQGREWAQPLLEGVVDEWVDPLMAMFEREGIATDQARIAARLSIAVARGLLLDVLATGEEHQVDAAMKLFSEILMGYLAMLPPTTA